MADTGIFATTAEVEHKAGKNCSAVSKAEAYTNDYMTQVESFINASCLFNFSDVYTTLNADTKGILKEISSNLAAIYVIQYDLSGFNSRIEAEDMINVLRDRALAGLALLKDRKAVDFVKGP
jgi:hypothetical protein